MIILYLPKIIKVEGLIDVTNNIVDEQAFANAFSEFLKDNRWKSIDGKVTLFGMDTVDNSEDATAIQNKEKEEMQ